MRRSTRNLGFLAILLVALMALLGGPDLPLSVFAGIFLAVLVHEAGHAIAGALMGLRVTGIALGPVELDCASGNFRPRWNRRPRAIGLLTFELNAVPPAKAVEAWRLATFTGPLANFLLAILLIWVNLTILAGQADAQAKLAIVAAISALFGTVSLIPVSWGLTSSDGAILRRIWTGGVVAENEVCVRQLGNWLASSTRPCQWPANDLAIADSLIGAPPSMLSPSARVTAIYYKYCYLADCGDLRAALTVLEQAVPTRTLMSERTLAHPVDLLIVLLARHYALWGNDTPRAQILLGMLHPLSWVRSGSEWQTTTALVALGKGDRPGAISGVGEARQLVTPLAARFGVVRMESDWLDKAEKRIDRQMTAPAVAPAALEKADPRAQPAAFASHRPPRLTPVEPQPEPKPTPIARTPRNDLQHVTVAFSRTELVASRPQEVGSELGVDRSWLYRAPGIPVEPNRGLAQIPLPNPWTTTVAPRRLTATR